MTWQGVPWAIGGGAEHPPEVARLLAYIAADGRDGVIGPGDLQVRKLAVAGAGIRVMPGAGSVVNRFTGGGQQAYLVRNPDEDTVMITPTGSGGGRTDLVTVVVEDPQYAGQPTPANLANGPYVRTRVYTNVNPAVKTMTGEAAMALVAPGQSGMALAAYTLGASDATIEQADIVDLRTRVQSRTLVVNKLLNLPGGGVVQTLTSGSMIAFPSAASYAVDVPSWAVRVGLELIIGGVELYDSGPEGGDWTGEARVTLGSIATPTSEVRPPASRGPGNTDTFMWLCAGNLDVPKAMRGTTQTLRAEARRVSAASGLVVRTTWGTTAVLRATFQDAVDSTYWDV